MTAFQYIAVNNQGKRVKGVAEGDSARHIRQQLRDKQLSPLSIETIADTKSQTTTTKKSIFSFRTRKMSTADLSLVTRQMATLLHAGIPVDEVLTAVSEQTEKQSAKEILLGVRAKVLEGYGIAEGMQDFPSAFPVLYRTTVAAGEKSGKLDLVLEQLADYTEKQHYIKQKIKQAMIYPIMMMCVSMGIVIFMLIYVVPKIIAVFNQTNQVLPLATKILVDSSQFFQSYGWYVLLGIVLVIYIWTRLLKRKNFRRRVQIVLLKIPVIGRAIQTINGARFGRTLGILTAASVPVLEAMQASCQLIKPLPMSEKVEAAILKVREGTAIHVALQKTGYFVPMFVHLVASGESSGQLDKLLEKAAGYLEKEVEGLIQTALTLFEPLMIVVMGGIVLYIVMAIMLPIFALDQVS